MGRPFCCGVARLGPAFLVTITASSRRELVNHNQGGAEPRVATQPMRSRRSSVSRSAISDAHVTAEFAVHALRELVGCMQCGRDIDENLVIRTRGASLFEEPTNPAHYIGVERATDCSRLKHDRDVRALYADSKDGLSGNARCQSCTAG
jgi:hypothetical protein